MLMYLLETPKLTLPLDACETFSFPPQVPSFVVSVAPPEMTLYDRIFFLNKSSPYNSTKF